MCPVQVNFLSLLHTSTLRTEIKELRVQIGNENKDQNLILDENKRANVCCHSVQNLSSSRLLSRNVKVRKFEAVILPVVLYEC